MTPVEQAFMLKYLSQEVDALRKAIVLWRSSTEMPSFVYKEVLNADVARNEIKKILDGKVKL